MMTLEEALAFKFLQQADLLDALKRQDDYIAARQKEGKPLLQSQIDAATTGVTLRIAEECARAKRVAAAVRAELAK